MKVAGALSLIVGIVAGIVLLLVPTSVSVLGTDLDCGMPVRGMLGYDEGSDPDLADQCQQNSVIRVAIGGTVGVVGFVGGMLMLLLSPSAEDRERERRKEEHQRFTRWQWEHDRRKEWEDQQHQPNRQPPPFQGPPEGS